MKGLTTRKTVSMISSMIDFKGYRADCINDFALEYLDKRDTEKPFFMFISQLEPHHQNDHNTIEGYKETVEPRYFSCVTCINLANKSRLDAGITTSEIS